MDVACQTTIIDTGNTSFKLEQNESQETRLLGEETSVDRTNAWVRPSSVTPPGKQSDGNNDFQGFSAHGLDMIDMASILESSQLLSSQLSIEPLLSKMAEIILESTSSDLCGIVVEDEHLEWRIAAVGTADGVTSFPGGQPLETVDDQVSRKRSDFSTRPRLGSIGPATNTIRSTIRKPAHIDYHQVARQITNYVLRFKETVFTQNLLEDDRFSNVSESYLKRNPEGRAVICMPILHGESDLLGSIYVEGWVTSYL
jgi:GAF domain-containing protein